MRYKTQKNMQKAVQLIMEKGFDQDTAVSLAPKFFKMVKPGTPPVEHFISLITPKRKSGGKIMVKIYEFREHALTISGEKQDLLYLAELLRDAEGTVGDLRYKIEYAFDIDGIRSEDTESEGYDDPDYADHYLKVKDRDS